MSTEYLLASLLKLDQFWIIKLVYLFFFKHENYFKFLCILDLLVDHAIEEVCKFYDREPVRC